METGLWGRVIYIPSRKNTVLRVKGVGFKVWGVCLV